MRKALGSGFAVQRTTSYLGLWNWKQNCKQPKNCALLVH